MSHYLLFRFARGFSIRTAQTLYSGIFATGSRAKSCVSMLAGASRQWKARKMVPGGTLLILHEISREQVNAIHQRVQGIINSDRVPPAAEMRSLLVAAGFEEIQVEDATDHYLAVARKPAAPG